MFPTVFLECSFRLCSPLVNNRLGATAAPVGGRTEMARGRVDFTHHMTRF
jgi:hypothetical protein